MICAMLCIWVKAEWCCLAIMHLCNYRAFAFVPLKAVILAVLGGELLDPVSLAKEDKI
jgi:hypothetical protein